MSRIPGSAPGGEPSPEELLFLYLERREEDPERVLEDLCRAHPRAAGALRARVSLLAGAGLIPPARHVPADAPLELPERLGEFRVLRRIGAGGMGLVVLARQESLGRDVALKLVRPGHLLLEQGRERFRREVLAIARLNHPGIVPVYAVGEEAGIPFFAMEHVRGATLADVLRRLAGGLPAKLAGADLDRALAELLGEDAQGEPAPLFRGSYAGACLRIVREVAEALEHAHRLGVIHRDLKPSNVMLTRGGRVLLLDFGLSSDDRAERLTRTGSQVGSLPYLPPEMLAGEARADRRSDVYSLGVTLYELLTLRLPFEGAHPAALSARILAGAPEPIRRLNPAVGWEGETVCLTAMERERERRYPSASDLARDLTNVLERLPIAARRAGPALRARRFVERHPAWSVGGALGFLAFVVAPGLVAWRESRAAERLRRQGEELAQANISLGDSLKEVEAERERAETNYQRALQAVEVMLQKVGEESLHDVPRLQGVRQELLEEALRLHEEFLAERPEDPRQARMVARALHQSALIHGLLAQHAEAQALLQEEQALLEARLAEDADAPRALGESLYRSAQARRLQSDVAGATDCARRAILLLEPLAAHGAGEVEAIRMLAAARVELGVLLAGAGDAAGARASNAQAILELRAAAERDRGARTREILAVALFRSGTAGFSALMAEAPDDVDARAAALEEALELRRGLVEETGGLPSHAYAVCEALEALAHVRGWQGRAAERIALLREGAASSSELVSAFPDVPKYLDAEATFLSNIGNDELAAGRLEPGAATFARASFLFKRLLERHPEQPGTAQRLAYARFQESFAAEGLGDPDGALRLALAGLEAHERAEPRAVPPEVVAALQNQVARWGATRGARARAAEAARGFAALGDRSSEFFGGLCLLLAAGAAPEDEAAELEAEGYGLVQRALDAGLTHEEARFQLDDAAMIPLGGLDRLRSLLAEHGLEGALGSVSAAAE